MKLIKTITLENPPTKYVKRVKKRKAGSKKKTLDDTYYLTANLFYSSRLHFTMRTEIITFAKDYLLKSKELKELPKLDKMRMYLTYSRPTDSFDLDNKIYFWQKVLLDLMKKPTNSELEKSIKKRHQVRNLSIVDDDTCKYIDELRGKYNKGNHKLIIEIYGIEKDFQKILV